MVEKNGKGSKPCRVLNTNVHRSPHGHNLQHQRPFSEISAMRRWCKLQVGQTRALVELGKISAGLMALHSCLFFLGGSVHFYSRGLQNQSFLASIARVVKGVGV